MANENKKVWKFGSRWSDEGDPKTRIADSIFKKYNIAFANTNAVLDIVEKDLVAIGDGHNIIAIGEVTSPPCQINQFGIACAESDIKYFLGAGNVCGCTVRYFWLDKKDQFVYVKAGRFFHATNIEEQVNQLFNKLNQEYVHVILNQGDCK